MSALAAKDLVELVKQQETKFNELALSNGDAVTFTQECLFARQQLLKNNYTLKAAANAPQSLQAAILNVAAIGISLNPATSHAYLVPRSNQICLDISFKGLVKLATDCGAIKWAKAELVYENDTFEWCGPTKEPIHKADPFGDRGNIKGGYCIAKMPDGDFMVDVMSVEEINKVRDTSKAANNGPWVNWYEEMAKKTLIKRAYKSWPQTESRARVDKAVEVLNEHEGMAYTIDEHSKYLELLKSGDALGFFFMLKSLSDDVVIALYNSGVKGQKVKQKEAHKALEKAGFDAFQDLLAQVGEAFQDNDLSALSEIAGELTDSEFEFVCSSLNQDEAEALTKIKSQAE